MSRSLGRIERAILASIAASKRMAINRTEKYREVIEAAIAAGGVRRFERVYTPQEGTARKRWTVKSGTVGRRYRCASRLVSTHGAARREFDAALGTTNAQPELRQGLEVVVPCQGSSCRSDLLSKQSRLGRRARPMNT